jgi:hypothetical protein
MVPLLNCTMRALSVRHLSLLDSLRHLLPHSWVVVVLLAVTEVSGQSVSENINSVTVTSGDYVIASDASNGSALYNRDKIRVLTNVTFDPSGAGSATYRLSYRLLNDSGSAMLLENGAGGGVTRVQGNPFTRTFSNGNAVSANYALSITPRSALEPGRLYRWEVTIEEENFKGGFDAQDVANGSLRRYFHFTSKDPSDDLKNVLVEVDTVAFTRETALQTASNAALRTFAAQVVFRLHRYDRWDQSPVTSAVQGGVTYDLRRTSDSKSIEIETTEQSWTRTNVPDHVVGGGGVKEPSVTTGVVVMQISPEDQLESFSELYDLRISIEHIDQEGKPPFSNGGNFDSPDTRLLHFNGELTGSGNSDTLIMTEITDEPPQSLLASSILTAPDILAAHVEGNSGFGIVPAGQFFLMLFDDGHAELLSSSDSIQISPPSSPDVGSLDNFSFQRSGLSFSQNGFVAADLVLRLPVGLGYFIDNIVPDNYPKLYNAFLEATDVDLGQNLAPEADLSFFPPTNKFFHLVEESKPLGLVVSSITWDIDLQFIRTSSTGVPASDQVYYIRKAEVEALANAPIPTDDKLLRSNELVYRYVDTLNNFANSRTWRAGPAGEALTTLRVNMAAGAFRTHFPSDAFIKWTSGGQLVINNDIPSYLQSYLDGVVAIDTGYARDCASTIATGCGQIGPQTTQWIPNSNRLRFTPDGGLIGVGTALSGSSTDDQIKISYIDAAPGEQYVHQTSALPVSHFLLAGHALSTPSDLSEAVAGAATLHNSGFNINSGSLDQPPAERPGTAAYLDGLGDYPGINFRISSQTGVPTASSYLAGNAIAPYALAGRSKFYTRPGGVNGILQPEAVPPDIDIYGYTTLFTAFGLSFLNSEVHESVTRGAFNLPYPSTLFLNFDQLSFDCIGRPEGGEIIGAPLDADLDFWAADITIQALTFEAPAGFECDPSVAFLTLGVRAWASNIPLPLAGSLAFNTDGTIVTQGGQVLSPENVDSRLSLPQLAEVIGPDGRNYPFTPAHNAYFDAYGQAADTSPGMGNINLLGFLDVPFFEDFQVHLQTKSREANTTDLIYMLGGWTEADGDTPFDSAQFDTNHTGYPDNGNLADYRDTEAEATDELPLQANQEWLGIVTFNYDLSWNSTTRTFKAAEPRTSDFLVLNTFHELTYLDPEIADFDFGANLGLQFPELNLQNIAGEALGSITSTFEDQLASGASEVASALVDGIDAGGELLNDQLDSFFDSIFAETIDPLIDAMYDEIVAANGDIATIQAIVNDYMDGTSGQITQALNDLNGAIGDAGTIIEEVDARLGQFQVAIRSIIGRVELAANGEIIIPDSFLLDVAEDLLPDQSQVEDVVDGLFAKENDVYNTTEVLIAALITDLAGELAANLAVLATNELNEQIAALLEEAEPTIEQVKGVLVDAHNAVGDVRTQLQTATGIHQELQDAFDNASAEITAFMDQAKAQVNGYFEEIMIPEFDPEEVKAQIRQEIRDRFNASPLIAEVQVILKQYVYDLEALIQQGISTLFAEINRLMLDAVAEYLPTDGAVQGFLDDLSALAVAAEITGYAQVNGDAIRKLRLDCALQMKLPDDFGFDGFVEINQLDSFGDDGCSFAGEGEYAAECIVGANNIGVSWVGDGLRFNIAGKFSFDTVSGFNLRGMGGAFEMTEGTIGIEAVSITDLAAAAMFGLDENYLAAAVGMKIDQYILSGGVFFGRACSLDPLLLIDPDVGNVLGSPPFTGIYTFGEGQFPIFGASCIFSLQVIAGAGVFIFEEGPTIGGKMIAGAVGKALCAVEIGGRVELIGSKSGNDFSFFGRGTLFGEVGACPLCITFDESVEISYSDSTWEYSF